MKLPLSLIKAAVGNLVVWKNECDETFLFSRPVFFDPDMTMSPDSIFILDKKTDGIDPTKVKMMITADETTGEEVDCIAVSQLGKLKKIWNLLNSLFNQYEEWESELKTLCMKTNSIAEMMHMTSKLTGLDFTLMNLQYIIIATTLSEENITRNQYPPIDENGHIPEELVNFFKYDPTYQEAAGNRGTFYYDCDFFPGELICHNLFHENIYVARLVGSRSGNVLQKWDGFILETFVSYLEYEFIKELKFVREEMDINRILKNLLSGASVSQSEMMQMMASQNWRQEDFYRIASFMPSKHDLSNNTLEFYCERIENIFHCCRALTFNRQIVVLFNLKKTKKLDYEFHQKLMVFIRENNFRVGFSRLFHDFREIPQFFTQASLAAAYGEKRNPTIWIHYFTEYVMPYIKDQCCKEIAAKNLCAEEIMTLWEYDKKNKTELCRTLEIFLEEDKSPVQASRVLFIQRGTLNYRLKRICELTGLDFNDKEQLSYISFSYMLLKNENCFQFHLDKREGED